MKIKVIGIGACGNNVGIDLIKHGLLVEEDIILINTTTKDVPSDFKDKIIIFEGSTGGSGKERDISKNLSLTSMRQGKIGQILEDFVEKDSEAEQYVIISSTSGGTGSGSAGIIGAYIHNVLKRPVQIVGFTGKESDARELQNTVEFMQDIPEGVTVQLISNKKFLEQVDGNIIKAEKLANMEFLQRFSVMTGIGRIEDSDKTLDDKELRKLVTTPGYIIVGHTNLEKIKNVDQFNKTITQMIDDNKSLETEKSAARLGVIINATEETQNFIDFSWSVFRDKFGNHYEEFFQVQYDDKQPEYVSFIVSGLNLPIKETKETYEKYLQESDKVNKQKDDFFNFTADLKGNSEDTKFNTGNELFKNSDVQKDKSAFFEQFQQPKPTFSNTVSTDVKDLQQEKENFFKEY